MTAAQNNTKGILFILIGMIVFSIQDALIKFIYEDTALYELYLGRTLSAAFFLFCYMKFTKQKVNFKTHYPLLTTIRIICFFFGFSFFYISLTYMSLAMANALFFSSPFFVSILAVIFLNEKVGIRRWLAISAGFIGVFIVSIICSNKWTQKCLLEFIENHLKHFYFSLVVDSPTVSLYYFGIL